MNVLEFGFARKEYRTMASFCCIVKTHTPLCFGSVQQYGPDTPLQENLSDDNGGGPENDHGGRDGRLTLMATNPRRNKFGTGSYYSDAGRQSPTQVPQVLGRWWDQ